MTEVPERVREAYQELPSGWKLEKLKFFANIRNSNVDKTISEDEEPVRLCNYTDVYYNDRITPDLAFMAGSATKAEIERFHLKRHQVIITKDSEGWDDIGIPALVAEDMPEVLCGYHLSVLEPGPDLDGGFLAWLCRAEPLNDQFKLTANGVTRFALGQYAMKNAFIALPPLETQRRITRFLDEKTARIEGLIEKKQELLDRLGEMRQALITRAVTNGLDPAAHARSDRVGHRWARKGDQRAAKRACGGTEIPERTREAYQGLPSSWKLEKLKFFANIRNSNVDKTISEDEEPVRLCNYTDVYYNDRITPDLAFMAGSATKAEIERFHLKRHQVIITKDSEGWDDIGIPALVAEDMPEVLCGYHLSVLEPGPDLDGGFLAWLCRAEPLNDQFKLTANGVTRFGIGQYAMKNAFMVVPPLNTQRRIARFLDEKTARIDRLGDKIRDSITRLEEYRTALVTAAVTGQLGEMH